MDERGLGKQLQAARQAAGLTQQQLCNKANLSFSTLTKIERGAIKSPSIFTVQAIANALGKGLDELLGNGGGRATRQLSKTKNGASFIFFDVYGCMVNFSHAAFNKLSAQSGITADIIEMSFWRYNDEVCSGAMSLSDLNANMAQDMGLKSLKWQDYYLDTAEPVKEMHKLLQWASERYKVGLLTNIMPGLLGAMRREGLVPDLAYDAIIDSSEVGAIKPDAQIYKLAQQRAGVPAQEILLIDDIRANVVAAGKLGWQALWFNDAHPEASTKRIAEALEPTR